MATMTAYMPVMGTPTDWAIMTVRTREDEGMGVVPMEARVESSTMMVYWAGSRRMPWVWARKTTQAGK